MAHPFHAKTNVSFWSIGTNFALLKSEKFWWNNNQFFQLQFWVFKWKAVFAVLHQKFSNPALVHPICCWQTCCKKALRDNEIAFKHFCNQKWIKLQIDLLPKHCCKLKASFEVWVSFFWNFQVQLEPLKSQTLEKFLKLLNPQLCQIVQQKVFFRVCARHFTFCSHGQMKKRHFVLFSAQNGKNLVSNSFLWQQILRPERNVLSGLVVAVLCKNLPVLRLARMFFFWRSRMNFLFWSIHTTEYSAILAITSIRPLLLFYPPTLTHTKIGETILLHIFLKWTSLVLSNSNNNNREFLAASSLDCLSLSPSFLSTRLVDLISTQASIRLGLFRAPRIGTNIQSKYS